MAKSKQAKQQIRIVNINELAARLHITPRRVQQLVSEGLPREARGRYDLDRVLDWYIQKLERQIAGESDEEGSIGYNKERARDRAASADMKELRLAQDRRELVSIADAEKAMTDLVVSTKAKILAVPARISLNLVGADPTTIRESLEKELLGALAELAKRR